MRAALALAILFLPVLFILYGPEGILVKGSRSKDITVIIKPGTSSFSIAQQFVQKKVFSYPWFFLAAQHLHYPKKKLKAGEYLISKTNGTIKPCKEELVEITFTAKKE